MLVKNLFYQCAIAVALILSLLLFYQCNPTTCNLPAPTLNISNISATAAKVSWGSLNTAPADDYQVELLDANTNSIIATTFTANTDYTFANLAANKAYVVRVTPRCDVNTASSNQGSVNFNTLNTSVACNLPAPTLLTIVPLTANSASLTWEPVQTAISYQVTVFDSTANTARVFNITPPPAMTLDSLVTGHKYSIKVAARCANGEVSPNPITKDFQPFIIDDNVLMFGSKMIADNCNLNAPTIPLTNGQSVTYAPFKIYVPGPPDDIGSSFLIRANHTSGSTADIRVIYRKKPTGEIIVSAGLNCTTYSTPTRVKNVVSKIIGTSGGTLSVALFWDHIEVSFPTTSGFSAKLQRLP